MTDSKLYIATLTIHECNLHLFNLFCTSSPTIKPQRTIQQINPMKMARCIVELERIYGIRRGGSGSNQYNKVENMNNSYSAKTQKDLAILIYNYSNLGRKT